MEEKRMCCKAMTPECLACDLNISVEEYCKNNPDINGCEKYTEKICCEAMTPECLACDLNISVEEYCKNNPDINGCIDYTNIIGFVIVTSALSLSFFAFLKYKKK